MPVVVASILIMLLVMFICSLSRIRLEQSVIVVVESIGEASIHQKLKKKGNRKSIESIS